MGTAVMDQQLLTDVAEAYINHTTGQAMSPWTVLAAAQEMFACTKMVEGSHTRTNRLLPTYWCCHRKTSIHTPQKPAYCRPAAKRVLHWHPCLTHQIPGTGRSWQRARGPVQRMQGT